jgi:hypothetical protein
VDALNSLEAVMMEDRALSFGTGAACLPKPKTRPTDNQQLQAYKEAAEALTAEERASRRATARRRTPYWANEQ